VPQVGNYCIVTLFKAGRVVWCGAVGYASGLKDVARLKSL